jgi:hypothetical protein
MTGLKCVCNKYFLDSKELRDHIITSGRGHGCTFCPWERCYARFCTFSELNLHMEQQHIPLDPDKIQVQVLNKPSPLDWAHLE